MKARLIDQISGTEIANAAVRLWGGDVRSLRRVSNSANRVYAFLESGATRYLRLTSGRDRTRGQVEAELDFITYLRRGDVRAMRPMPSAAGRLIEEVGLENDVLFGCVFEEAEGEEFRYDPAKDNRDHFALCGRSLGQIHALSRAYVPSTGVSRCALDENNLLLDAGEFLPKSEKVVWHAYDQLREWLRSYPRSAQTFGLIHGDLGPTNYRRQGDLLNVFDFDDCCHHWFVYDLAITIYPHGWRREGLQFLDSLLRGYCEHMNLDVKLAELTRFCQWRLVYMFLVNARRWGLENVPERQAEWFARKRENLSRGYRWST